MRQIVASASVGFAVGVAVLASVGCAPPAGDAAAGCVKEACLAKAICQPGQASAQFRRQAAPPSLIAPWQREQVSVTFANCSGQTWTQSEFALRPAGAVDAQRWGVSRVALPVDVPDGNEVTVPFEVTGPPSSGNYPFAWAIMHEGVELYEQPSPTVMVRVAAPADCSAAGPPARFRTQVPPAAFVATGARVHASVTFANCTAATWPSEHGVVLGSRAVPDDVWGTRAIALPFDVPPEREVTIAVELTAPSHPGRYEFAWQLQQNGAWLSEPAPSVTTTVLDGADCSGFGPPARFLSQNVPNALTLNQTADVSARFANCSGRVWDGGYSLDSALAGQSRPLGAGPIALPFSVGSGFAIDIAFQIHAPGAAGTYPFRYGILGPDGVLDQPTPETDIVVRCTPSCGDHNCGDDGCGGSCGSCGGGSTCDGAHCQSSLPSCGAEQWWNTYLTYESIDYGWHDTDSGVRSNTPIQLRHDSRLDKHGVYGWGYMPEFTDLVTGYRFRFLHLRPQNQNATNNGQVYPAGYIVGLSGGDTADTGLPTYSTGAHLCVQTLSPYRDVFPKGVDACR